MFENAISDLYLFKAETLIAGIIKIENRNPTVAIFDRFTSVSDYSFSLHVAEKRENLRSGTRMSLFARIVEHRIWSILS